MSNDQKDKTLILRSSHSYGKTDKNGFIHRSWMKSEGLPDDVFDGRPVIGICNTWSELTPCNIHLRDIAEHVKRGVWEAGGLPLEFPVTSLGETQMRPTAMLYRNLLAMDTEESIRGNPIDGVVLLGGCDKTTPGQLIGAASVNLPTAIVSSGPMLNGKFRGQDIGSGTDVWKFSEEVRSGTMSIEDFMAAESSMSRSHGTCMTMGSASSFAAIVETLGLSLPMNATIPAVDSRRKTLAHLTGRRIVEMVNDDLRLSTFLTRKSLENAIYLHAAIGGSTNSIIHLLAIAGRLGIGLTLEDFDQLGRKTPLLVNVQPSGKYLMEDLHYAGGIPAVLKELLPLLHDDCETISGKSIATIAANASCYQRDVITSFDQPFKPTAGIWVLKGNICPDGAIIKPSAATPELCQHRGKALVFDSIEDLHARIDDPELEVDPTSILVLRGCGPKGYPGMAEVGNMPLPKKLLEAGVSDMIRISDARMSGTAFGTVILHAAPESAANGPIALLQTGDIIDFNGYERTLTMEVPEEELERRRTDLEQKTTPEKYTRGYYKLYIDHVMQADKGCDLDFLVGHSSDIVERESH